MATSAFRSTTKRTPIGKSDGGDDSGGSSSRSSAHRRSRSLSGFSRPIPAAAEFSGEPPPPRGRFVNTVRGSGFPEISLDDLAVELYGSGSGGRGRSSDSSGAAPELKRRGRSVTRQWLARAAEIGNGGRGNVGNYSGGGRVVPETNSRRRRSMSVVRYQVSDSESDLDNSKKSNRQTNSKSVGTATNQKHSSATPTTLNHRQGLRRSLSERDLKPNNGYSSQFSTLTDDEGKDGYYSKNGIERTIRALYAQKNAEHPTVDDIKGGLYEAMRKELRYAVKEIKMELGQAVEENTSDSGRLQSYSHHALQAASTIRKNYATNLEQSEKRTQELLAELVLEEQRGRELSKIVKELLPDSKNNVAVDKSSRPRRRSNDRHGMSRRLTEEAEKYIEDFISNVEDTDISSLDGERSDTSSIKGGTARLETFQSPPVSKVPPVEMDGVVLPWLQWETAPSPQSCNSKMQPPPSTRTGLWDAAQEVTNVQDHNIHSPSSRGSWSPGVVDVSSTRDYTSSKSTEPTSCINPSLSGEPGLCYDVDDYLKPPTSEEQLFEICSQRERINSGTLLLCDHNHTFF